MGVSASPNDSSFVRSHAIVAAEVGRFAQTAADLDKLITLTPDDHILYMQAACVHLYLGDQEAYRNLCERMFERFAKNPDARVHDRIAKTCLAGPNAVKDLTPIANMARSNIAPQTLEKVTAARCVGVVQAVRGNGRVPFGQVSGGVG